MDSHIMYTLFYIFRRCVLSEQISMNECCSNPSIHDVCNFCDQNSETEVDISDCLCK